MSRYAEKRSFEYCAETCTSVSDVFDKFIDQVKEISTYRMREALTSACSDLIAAEEQIEDLRKQVEDKDYIIEDMRKHIRDLQKQEEA